MTKPAMSTTHLLPNPVKKYLTVLLLAAALCGINGATASLLQDGTERRPLRVRTGTVISKSSSNGTYTLVVSAHHQLHFVRVDRKFYEETPLRTAIILPD
jgi:hypothetical protein